MSDWSQADRWFFDEAQRRRDTLRRLGRLQPPRALAERHEAAVAAATAARDVQRQPGTAPETTVERMVDALLAADALEAAVAAEVDGRDGDYARRALDVLRASRAEFAAARERAETEGARALERLRALRPPAGLEADHTAIVEAFSRCLDALHNQRRFMAARDRPEALDAWAAVESRYRELHDALARASG